MLLTHDVMAYCPAFQIGCDTRSLIHFLLHRIVGTCYNGEAFTVKDCVWRVDCMQLRKLPLLAGDAPVVSVDHPTHVTLVKLYDRAFQLLFGLGSF